MRATVTIVGSVGRDLVETATLILVVKQVIEARAVRSPCTHAVHGLSATTVRPLLVHVGERAAVTVVGRVHGDLVVAVPLVLVIISIV